VVRREASFIGENLELVTCGSYRRGKEMCGDVDILITSPNPHYIPRLSKRLHQTPFHPLPPLKLPSSSPFLKGTRESNKSEEAIRKEQQQYQHQGLGGSPGDEGELETAKPTVKGAAILDQILMRLRGIGFLTDDLVLPSEKSHYNTHKNIYDGHDNEIYMGICRLAGPNRLHRRIDLKVYHVSEFPFAVLYFTGSKEFNKAIRLYANKHFRLSLSDHALTPYKEGQGREKYASGTAIPCRTEQEIFTALNLPYYAPNEREGVPAKLMESKPGAEKKRKKR